MRAYNFIIKSITRILIILKETTDHNDFFKNFIFIFTFQRACPLESKDKYKVFKKSLRPLVSFKMIKLLVILFITEVSTRLPVTS